MYVQQTEVSYPTLGRTFDVRLPVNAYPCGSDAEAFDSDTHIHQHADVHSDTHIHQHADTYKHTNAYHNPNADINPDANAHADPGGLLR